MKGIAIVDRRPIDIFKVIGNESYRRQYDSTYDGGETLELIADQTFFVYQKSKKVAIVSAREFIIIMHYNMV